MSQQPASGEDWQLPPNDLGFTRRQRAGLSQLTQLAAEATTGPLPIVTAATGPVTGPRAHSHRKYPTGVVATLMEHRTRFAAFSVIGAAIFVMGIAIQAWLTGRLHMNAYLSFLLQGIVSVQASFVANYYWTWHDQNVAFWPACGKFNVQKVAVSVGNLVVYAALVEFGMNYLLANVVTTAVFTVANYVMSHLWVFTSRKDAAAPPVHMPARPTAARGFGTAVEVMPTVSVIIPCRNNAATIRATVDSLLGQDYPTLQEVILVGSTGDSTWSPLADVRDPRLVMLEQEKTPGKRDPNVKRDKGLHKASGEVLALADSDIVMDPDWLRCAVRQLLAQGGGVVAGGMKRIHDTFWGRFVDRNVLAAKTPRVPRSYSVTAGNFGHHRSRPPITANAVFTRDVYESCPLDVAWAYGYEDYEWFWRVAKAGHKIWFAGDISGAHHHRRRFRDLITEYRRSAEGCSHFIRRHPDSPLAVKRRRQAIGLPLAAAAGLVVASALVADGLARPVTGLVTLTALVLMGREMLSARRLEAAVYPYAGAALGMVFTWTLATNLARRDSVRGGAPTWDGGRGEELPSPAHRAPRRLSWPLVAVLTVQAALSLSLVWSNTAFADEADYLWQGRMEWAHWLHGTPLPKFGIDSGAPQLYPALGAIANAIGGLAAARILSLIFMLTSTVLLYLTARQLFTERSVIMGVALWSVSEPALRLAFATYDALSCMLMIFAVWLGVQAAVRKRRGELVALSAMALALGSLTTFSFAIMVPAIVVILFFAWWYRASLRTAAWCASWLGGVSTLLIVAAMSIMHLWPNLFDTTVHRKAALGNSFLIVTSSAWYWDGLLFGVAAAGVVIAFVTEHRWCGKLLVASLAGAGTVVVAYQAHLGATWSLDKHMSAGTGLLSIAAGYGLSKLRLPAWKPAAIWGTTAAFLSYSAISGLWYAQNNFHSWGNVASLVKKLQTSDHARGVAVGEEQGTFFVLQYYLPHMYEGMPSVSGIERGIYPRVVLTLGASYSSSTLPLLAVRGHGAQLNSEVLRLADSYAGNKTDYRLLLALGQSPRYRVSAINPYSTTIPSNGKGLYVIWQRTGAGK